MAEKYNNNRFGVRKMVSLPNLQVLLSLAKQEVVCVTRLEDKKQRNLNNETVNQYIVLITIHIPQNAFNFHSPLSAFYFNLCTL